MPFGSLLYACTPNFPKTIGVDSNNSHIFILQDCNACYCIAIAHLINHPGDANGALREAEGWAAAHATPEVQEWLAYSSGPGLDTDCLTLIGFVKWGFTYAFRSVAAWYRCHAIWVSMRGWVGKHSVHVGMHPVLTPNLIPTIASCPKMLPRPQHALPNWAGTTHRIYLSM